MATARNKTIHLKTVPPIATDPDSGKLRSVVEGEPCKEIKRTSSGQVLVRLVLDGYLAEILPEEIQ